MKKLLLFGLVSLQLTATAQWTHVPNASSEDISVGSATQVLGVAGGRVWYLDPVALTMSQSNVWNNFTQVTIAEDGTAWAKGQGGIFKATAVDGNNTAWNLGSTSQLNNISCRNAQQVLGTLGAGTNGQANIYTFDGSTLNLLPGNGALAQVSIGTDGTIYGVYGTASGNNVYRYTGSGWSLVPIALNQISVGDATHIVGRYNGTPYYYDASVQGWIAFARPVESNVTDIEVAADGTIYALSSEWLNNVYRTTWGAVTGTGCPQLTTGPLGPAITGPETVCAGAEVTYTAAEDANATFYTWTLSNGFTGSSTTNSITVSAPNVGGQQLAFSVTAGNDCFESVAASWSPVVTEAPTVNVTETYALCEGATLTFGTQTITEVGDYIETFTAVNGCDSIVTLTVTLSEGLECAWEHVPGARLTNITCGSSSLVAACDASGFGWHLNTGTDTWVQAPTAQSITNVSMASDGTLFFIGTSNNVYRTLNFNGTYSGSYTGGQVTNVSAQNGNYAVGANAAQGGANIYLFNGSNWTLLPGGGFLQKVAVGDDATTYGLFTGNNSFYFHNGSTWILQSGTLEHVAVANASRIIGVSFGNLVRKVEVNFELTDLPRPNGAAIIDADIAGDGTIYVLTDEVEDNVYRTTWDLLTAPIVTGVNEATARGLAIYPNPANGQVTMDGLTAGSTITLMDAMGRTVSSTAVTAARMEVSVAALSTGIYMVQVMDGNNVRTARLVVN